MYLRPLFGELQMLAVDIFVLFRLNCGSKRQAIALGLWCNVIIPTFEGFLSLRDNFLIDTSLKVSLESTEFA